MTQVVRTDANVFGTACERNSVSKRKAISVRFRVRGHMCSLKKAQEMLLLAWSHHLISEKTQFISEE